MLASLCVGVISASALAAGIDSLPKPRVVSAETPVLLADASNPLFTVPSMQPGRVYESCVAVGPQAGSTKALQLSGSTSGSLGAFVDLNVDSGFGPNPGAAHSCSGFSPTRGLYQGLLTGFPSTGAPVLDEVELPSARLRVYRFSIVLPASRVDAAGSSAAYPNFTWSASLEQEPEEEKEDQEEEKKPDENQEEEKWDLSKMSAQQEWLEMTGKLPEHRAAASRCASLRIAGLSGKPFGKKVTLKLETPIATSTTSASLALVGKLPKLKSISWNLGTQKLQGKPRPPLKASLALKQLGAEASQPLTIKLVSGKVTATVSAQLERLPCGSQLSVGPDPASKGALRLRLDSVQAVSGWSLSGPARSLPAKLSGKMTVHYLTEQGAQTAQFTLPTAPGQPRVQLKGGKSLEIFDLPAGTGLVEVSLVYSAKELKKLRKACPKSLAARMAGRHAVEQPKTQPKCK